MSTKMWAKWGRLSSVAVLALVLIGPGVTGAQEAEGFDGYIQSGTCAAPTDDVRVNLKSYGPHDVEPYLAKTAGTQGETVVLGYYGSPEAPGFGLSAIYTDQQFSLVIADIGSGDPVACGDILQPDAPRFGAVGVAVVQLLPVGDSVVEGVAVIQRTQLERELDVAPTRVRILLTSGVEVSTPPGAVVGYDGSIRSGSCAAPTDTVRVELQGAADPDITPYLAKPAASGEPITVAYYGAPGAPGFGLAAIYTDQPFSLVIADVDGGGAVACGDIVEPARAEFSRAGLALVRLLPVADPGVHGYALIERTPLERELDVTPTRVRILVFAPSAASP